MRQIPNYNHRPPPYYDFNESASGGGGALTSIKSSVMVVISLISSGLKMIASATKIDQLLGFINEKITPKLIALLPASIANAIVGSDSEDRLKHTLTTITVGNAIESLAEGIRIVFSYFNSILATISKVTNIFGLFNEREAGPSDNKFIDPTNYIAFSKTLFTMMKNEGIPERFIVTYLILISITVPFHAVLNYVFVSKSKITSKDEAESADIMNYEVGYGFNYKTGLSNIEKNLLSKTQKVIVKFKQAETDIDKNFKLSRILIVQSLYIMIGIIGLVVPGIIYALRKDSEYKWGSLMSWGMGMLAIIISTTLILFGIIRVALVTSAINKKMTPESKTKSKTTSANSEPTMSSFGVTK